MSAPKTKTYDGRPVYAHDAELPQGALGWVMCDLPGAGGYASWMDTEDVRAASRAFMAKWEKDVKRATKAQLVEYLTSNGVAAFTVQDKRRLATSTLNTAHAKAFPLRLAKDETK